MGLRWDHRCPRMWKSLALGRSSDAFDYSEVRSHGFLDTVYTNERGCICIKYIKNYYYELWIVISCFLCYLRPLILACQISVVGLFIGWGHFGLVQMMGLSFGLLRSLAFLLFASVLVSVFGPVPLVLGLMVLWNLEWWYVLRQDSPHPHHHHQIGPDLFLLKGPVHLTNHLPWDRYLHHHLDRFSGQ